MSKPEPRWTKLRQEFYAKPAEELARELLGKVLVRRVNGVLRRARIVESEAYCGVKDLASHSSKGRTPRTEVMFGPAGRAYVYFVYGMHEMFNIVGGSVGDAQAVLVRAAEALDGWKADLTGPAKLAAAFEITRKDNGMDLSGEDLFIVDDPRYRAKNIRTKRIGVDYAKRWKDRLLRFIDVNSEVGRNLKR
ncbi:MAG TPA: DNA-3-methyladenine glycosylase [Tepidisphaeraceae bacterium]|jgi:DNA-3-methyladenine glycosylase|nr:DNA-3-methyladenine glycosylase [Tepidisphaeraceae bacterium]